MNFIKENLFIVLGVTLPLILIVFLSVVQTIQKASIEAPQYSVAYITSKYFYNVSVVPKVSKDTKKLSVSLTKNHNNAINKDASLTVHIYEPSTRTSKDYKFDIYELDLQEKKTHTLTLPKELKNLTFIDNRTSPDGYTFEEGHYRSGNLMTEIFGYGNNHRKDSVTKKGIRIPLPERNGWHSTKFIGWVEQ